MKSTLSNSMILLLISLLVLMLLTSPDLYAFNGNVTLTLTPEQITEVEKDPEAIIKGCDNRIDLRFDPGKLCDAFSTYLQEKCERLDYLSDYCTPLANYSPKRILQRTCLSNPPSPNDTEGIMKCHKYITFNSTYPILLTLKGIYPNIPDSSLTTEFSVFNPNAVAFDLISISYDININGEKIIG